MTYKEWDTEAEAMTSKQRKQLVSAVKTLDKWAAFKKEYGWTGYSQFVAILELAEVKEQMKINRENKQ